MNETGTLFLKEAATFLKDVFLPKIERCLEELSDEEIWQRPNDASNSIGNLCLHLSGNVRQWIVSGLGGQPDRRVRQGEFDHRAVIPAKDLIRLLGDTVHEAASVLGSFDQNKLPDPCRIQGLTVTALHAVFHVVEHFSMHTGQIIMMTKLLKAKDLRFYDMNSGIPVERWRK